MKLKTKLIAGTSTLVMAGSMMAMAAPAAHAAITTVGHCTGAVNLIKITSATAGVGLTDQTQPVKAAGNLAADQTTHVKIAGNCSGVTRPGDTHIPNNNPLTTLTPISDAVVLTGNSSCANGATAQAVDATAASAYPLNGKITYTFSQHYTDLLTLASKPYTMQAGLTLLGFNPTPGPDVVDVGGLVLTGVNAGATISTTATGNESNIWEDPVSKTGGPTGYNTGYELALTNALGCADGTANNANITTVLSSGGGTAATSLLSSSTNGITFIFGQ